MKKLRNMQIISKLVVAAPLITNVLRMRNFMTNFVRASESARISPQIV